MEPSVGAWAVLKHVLNPGLLNAVVLVVGLPYFTPWAWGSEPPSEVITHEDGWHVLPLEPSKLGPEKLGFSLLLAQGLPPSPDPLSPAQADAENGRAAAALETVVAADAVGETTADGTTADGTTADGTTADGTTADGTTADGTTADGTTADGMVPSEPSRVLGQGPETPPEATLAPAERSEVFVQAAYLQQGGEGSARLRAGGIYVLSPSVFAGATADLSTGQAFSDSDQTGLSLSELYLTASPANLSELRFTVGLMDLTSYLDRNSFAKDSLTHFFNPVFQTNPALSTVNVASRPAALVNWMPIDQISLTATTFSSSRSLGSFALDSFAGEVGVRLGNAIVRGTYATSRDAGRQDGFAELGSFDRGDGRFGALPGDRETAYGLNAEVFIPGLKLGFFGRYGWYTNNTLGASGQTYSLGVNGLDVFLPSDRLGLGYGRQLSNNGLRQAAGQPTPDVWELFYDTQVVDNLRAGVTVQQRNAFTETYLGFRVRYDMRWYPLRRTAE